MPTRKPLGLGPETLKARTLEKTLVDQPKPRLTPGQGPGEKPAQEEVKYIPTRERLKLEPVEISEEDIAEARSQNKLAWAMIGGLVLVGALIGINMALTPKAVETDDEQVASAEDQTQDRAAADSTASDSTAHGDSTASSTPSQATPPPPPKPEPPKQTAATTPAVPLKETPPPTPFGIVVGSYLNEARAQEEATKLKDATSLEAKIEPFDDGGVTSYRVVLGSFPNRAAAERKANDLIGQDLVYEARVAPLK